MSLSTTARTIVASLAFAAFALTTTASFAAETKVPATAAEHQEIAKQYGEQATQYKKIAADHHAMVEAYKKQIALPVNKGGQKNPWLVKMEKHCEALAQDADKLATDSEKAADYHNLRAKELQGK